MCVRPQTYESEAEAKVLSYVFSGRSGLENTSFALLDPNGKKISRGSRSPSMTFGDAERFAKALTETAARYESKAKAISALPEVRDLRLALNVAAADMRPLVIVRGKDAKAAEALAKNVATAAWSKDHVGTCHYVVLSEETTFEGLTPELGVSIVQPDPYGLGGKVLAHAAPNAKAGAIAKAMAKGALAHDAKTKEHRAHIREARRRGIGWEPEIEVSDSRAKEGERRRRRR